MKSDDRLKLMQHNDRNKFLPLYILPEDPVATKYPNFDLKLSLEEGKKMRYTSWVLCPHYHTKPLEEFQNFMGEAGIRPCHYRLNENSYVRLMEYLGLRSEEFKPTEVLSARG
jgi:hypothetical protein